MKNIKGVFTTIGASNHSKSEREQNDFYVTPRIAIDNLIKLENFSNKILEPACGDGAISKVLMANHKIVKSSDLYDRGFGEVKDFFNYDYWDGDIITNPPYKIALEFAEHSLSIIPKGKKVAMFLRLLFLEGKKRGKFFRKNPPTKVYVSSSRLSCNKVGKVENYSSAVAFAWFVWEKGFEGNTIVKWFN